MADDKYGVNLDPVTEGELSVCLGLINHQEALDKTSGVSHRKVNWNSKKQTPPVSTFCSERYR